MLFLALDQSTSGTKALLFSGENEVLDRESRDHRQHYPQPGWVEHDAEEIWTNTIAVLDAIWERNPEQWPEVQSLSITNQRETLVVFDRESGKPLHRAIVWQCRRSESICDAHLAAGHEDLVHARTGLKIDPYFTASKLQWLMAEKPELAERVRDGSAVIGTIDAYLIHRLTKGEVFATDGTNASRTLLYDIVDRRWSQELCALWQVPLAALPEVRDSSADFGSTTLADHWPRPLPIRGVMGDSQAALFAQQCYSPGSAKVTFGTGSSVLLNLGSEPRLSDQGILTTLAWSMGDDVAYAYEGVIISSASTLTWLRDQLNLATSVDKLEAWAKSLEDNGGVYLVPAFTGMGLPHWAPDARAAIVGLSSHSDKRHLARAGFESVAFQVRDALDAMRREAGISLQEVAADGGATVSDFLMQFTADVTGVDINVSQLAECSALGAVMAGRVAEQDPAGDTVGLKSKRFRPQKDETAMAGTLAGWRAAVEQVVSR